jgi:hypothetical protein
VKSANKIIAEFLMKMRAGLRLTTAESMARDLIKQLKDNSYIITPDVISFGKLTEKSKKIIKET